MTKNPLLYGVLLLVLAVFVTQCCFTVHQTQQALVLQLGGRLYTMLPEALLALTALVWAGLALGEALRVERGRA